MLTEPEILAFGADLRNRFGTSPGEADADVTVGSALFAHNGVSSAARQLRRIAALKSKLAVEIGTARALTTVALARLCRSVVTIDIGFYALRAEVLRWAKADNAVSVVIPDDEHKTRLVGLLDFDFAFVDGDHTEAGCRLDFEITKRCGRVLVHDLTRPYPNGPLALFDEFHKSQPDQIIEDYPFGWWFASAEECARIRSTE
jgi:hypothetical protein